ncbi:MAG: type II toxin-antitoxin system RelE/ParE family toxin [Dehalococcoidia bacterium]
MSTDRPDGPEAAVVEFHPDAEVELERAAIFYEAQVAGLGTDFVLEVERAVKRAIAHPLAGTPLGGQRRRFYLRRFPYAVVYRALPGGRIRVLAVADLRRRPGYWRGRR